MIMIYLAAVTNVVTGIPAASDDRTITAPGPRGFLEASFREAAPHAPVVVIIPGSGPTDRNGNNLVGVTAGPYRLLAQALAARGISTIRIDKRGMFASKGAIQNPNSVTIADYAHDVRTWASLGKQLTGVKCAWVAGHSEGALVALAAAQNPKDICGVITLAGAGRPFGVILREQLRANPANEPLLPVALADINQLENGRSVDEKSVPAPLFPLFNSAVQPFLRDLLSYDPAQLAARVQLPMLIVQGGRDLQVSVADARALKAAKPAAKLVIIEDANHVLKSVPSQDRSANLAAYTNPDLPLAPGIVDAIASFVQPRRK